MEFDSNDQIDKIETRPSLTKKKDPPLKRQSYNISQSLPTTKNQVIPELEAEDDEERKYDITSKVLD